MESVGKSGVATMALWSRATYRPVSGLAADPPIIPVGVILHVSGGMATSLYGYFNGKSGGVESHLHIPMSAADPIEQYRDTVREADANYRGNSWIGGDGKRYGFLSVENQGIGDGVFTPYQIEANLEFCRWAAEVHNFPLRRCLSYRSPGIGYHVMFGSGEGTNSWSKFAGKICPGPRRIAQFNDVILPRLANASPPTQPTIQVPKEDDMLIRYKTDNNPTQYLEREDCLVVLDRGTDLTGTGEPLTLLTTSVLVIVTDAQLKAIVATKSAGIINP